MNEIVWLSHGGPGSGRYPKGSGKKYLKTANRYSRGYTRANYHRLKNQRKADRHNKLADWYETHMHERHSYERKAQKETAEQLKYQTKADNLSQIMQADQKKIDSIKTRLTKSMNVPLKTVQRSTVVDGYPIIIPPIFFGGSVTTAKYTKYKVDKKKLKKG